MAGGTFQSDQFSDLEMAQTVTSSKRGFISQNYDSTGSNIFAVIVTAFDVTGGSCSFYGSMQWRETR